jgi:hypothetical protein
LAMKSNRTGAIFNPWASIRFMMGFLKMASGCCVQLKTARSGPEGAALIALISAKAGAMRRPLAAWICRRNGQVTVM